MRNKYHFAVGRTRSDFPRDYDSVQLSNRKQSCASIRPFSPKNSNVGFFADNFVRKVIVNCNFKFFSYQPIVIWDNVRFVLEHVAASRDDGKRKSNNL